MAELFPDEIQAFVKTRIESHPSLAGIPWQLGQGVLIDDGTYPKIPGFEQSLAIYGLSIIAWTVQGFGVTDVVKTGTAIELLDIPVVIQENIKDNQNVNNPNATQIPALRLMHYIKEAVSGFPKVGHGSSWAPILISHEPFEDFGTLNGLRTVLVRFTKQNRVNPLST